MVFPGRPQLCVVKPLEIDRTPDRRKHKERPLVVDCHARRKSTIHSKEVSHINYDHCCFCKQPKTLEHCFFFCARLRSVWEHFYLTLCKFHHVSLSFKDIVLFSGSTAEPKAIMFSLVVETILYEIWNSRNRATFSKKTDNTAVIVRHIKNEISFRLKLEHNRLRPTAFLKLWGMGNILCEFDRNILRMTVP